MNHIKTKIMKTISKLKSVLVLMVFAAAIFSCSDSNETDYTGVNSIYVRTSEAPVMIASDSTPLKGSLTFTRAYDQPVALEMTVKISDGRCERFSNDTSCCGYLVRRFA